MIVSARGANLWPISLGHYKRRSLACSELANEIARPFSLPLMILSIDNIHPFYLLAPVARRARTLMLVVYTNSAEDNHPLVRLLILAISI